jgi:hypothetical protein
MSELGHWRNSTLPSPLCALVNRLEEEPHANPGTGTMQFSLRDPDGYYVTVSTIDPA